MTGGERDLETLLGQLNPELSPVRFAFDVAGGGLLEQGTFALIREEEGVTAIRAAEAGGWGKITLKVHSSLEAVGLTAVVSARLAEAGISANLVAGSMHDHVFVPWERRAEALQLIAGLSEGGPGLA